ncbi:CU044_2847 family protein [Micromonospora sp. NPDC048830]|uniref:CU044_2847 family protein n=1 Tax=Micromonospora sp. NPDC048830 TaxID=3364257 RepID=UPI00371CD934
MRELIEVRLPSGNTMWVTVDSDEESRDVGLRERFADLPGLAEIVDWVSSGVVAGLRHAKPDRLTVEFGVEMAVGERGLVAALGGIGGKTAVKVTMNWGPGDDEPGAEPPAEEPR